MAYAIGAVVLTLGYLGFSVHFAVKRSDAAARKLFLYSVLYLFVLLGLMILDKTKASA
jgi:heme O synthase-like polyprenyltransferase